MPLSRSCLMICSMTASLPVVTTLLSQSDMIVALPEAAVRSYCEAGMLTLLVRALPLGIGGCRLITRRNCKLSPPSQLILSALRDLAAELYPGREER